MFLLFCFVWFLVWFFGCCFFLSFSENHFIDHYKVIPAWSCRVMPSLSLREGMVFWAARFSRSTGSLSRPGRWRFHPQPPQRTLPFHGLSSGAADNSLPSASVNGAFFLFLSLGPSSVEVD
jgi:hypothetical protein